MPKLPRLEDFARHSPGTIGTCFSWRRAHGRYFCLSCNAAILFVGAFLLFEKELRDPRHWITPAHCLYLLMRRFDRCCVLGVAQCLDYPLRDSPHIVLAHPARGAGWRAEAQPTRTQGWTRIVWDDLLVRRNANAVERLFRDPPV